MRLWLSAISISAAAAYAFPLQERTNLTSLSKRNPIPSSVYRTRSQFAVNLGFWLVGERYGIPDHFAEWKADTKHNDELTLAKYCTKEQREAFWNTFMNEGDFALMQNMGINTVRLSIGYWTVGKENCQCKNTPFWKYIDKYSQQWTFVERAIGWAEKYNIGVLVDFHGAEGSQNGWEHAGIDTQKATFLDRKIYQDHTTSVLEWVARQIKDKNNVVGLQLLNEPHPDIHARYNSWYETTLLRIRSILGDDFPFYIGGSISDQIRMDWIRQQPGFIVMDYHLYPVFDDRYKEKTPKEQTAMLKEEYEPLFDKVEGINLIIGEWACTLADTKADWEGEKTFCDAQMQLLNRPPYVHSLSALASTAYKTQGDYFNSWSFLLASGGSDGLANRGGDKRPLLIPANDQSTFVPQSTSDLSLKATVNNLAGFK